VIKGMLAGLALPIVIVTGDTTASPYDDCSSDLQLVFFSDWRSVPPGLFRQTNELSLFKGRRHDPKYGHDLPNVPGDSALRIFRSDYETGYNQIPVTRS
jgi:hypothetical protein